MAHPDGRTIVHLYNNFYSVWDVAYAWHVAGRPPINDAGRTYGEQKYLYDGYQQGKPGFYPADNPDNSGQPRGHMRFAALDIDWTSERDRRLKAAGLVRPFSWEDWHWAAPDIYYYPIVHSIPADTKNIDYYLAPAVDPALLRRQKEDVMYIRGTTHPNVVYAMYTDAKGQPHLRACGPGEAAYAIAGGLAITGTDATLVMTATEGQYYSGPDRSVQDAVWNDTTIGRLDKDGKEFKTPALQELADIRTAQLKVAEEGTVKPPKV